VHAEDVFFANLSEPGALEAFVRAGTDYSIIPTEEARKIVKWCVEEFFRSGRTRAPSREAILSTWRNVIEDEEIDLGDGTETDTMEWAIDALKSHSAHHQVQDYLKKFGRKMAEADPVDRLVVLDTGAAELVDMSLALSSRESQTDWHEGVSDRLQAYKERQAEGYRPAGLKFHLREIDEHTFGVHPGELAVLAAGPKTGKSFFCSWVAIREAMAGKTVVLFTLENSPEMTYDRIICQYAEVNYRRFQRGECDSAEMASIETIMANIRNSLGSLHIIQPERGKRNVAAMVRKAQLLSADVLIIDQLTFIEHPQEGKRARNEIIRDIVHELKSLISAGHKMPCLLAHQINREGVKAAAKAGMLEMHHLAEGAEVERTADWVFGLFQSEPLRQLQQARFQILAARREDITSWDLDWEISKGHVVVSNEAGSGDSS
jgi:replicative DNA helicase